jgi:predicted HAD superfamily hydrolase
MWRAESMPDWRQDETLRAMEARLAPSAGRPRVVSFDFFDTLIFRLAAEPADLFVLLGRELEARGLLRAPMSPAQFRAARMTAEAKAREAVARTGKCPELKLVDIYAELREVVTHVDAARALEVSLERRVAFANPAMIALVSHVRSLGCKTAIVSDTYFTADELLRLLDDHGVPRDWFDAVIVSCERGKAKWHNGTLYHDLFQKFDAHPGEIVHIGDNLHADVYMARQLGIDTLHYYRTTPDLKAIFAGETRQLGTSDATVGSLETLRVLTARKAEVHDDPFRDGALTLGPVLARFADWCVEKYTKAGVTRVLALMREGELLGELLDRSAKAAGVNLEIVICYASRMATARAAMTEVKAESAAALLEGSHQITPQAILEILGLGEEASQFLDDETRVKPLPSHDAAVDLLKILFRMGQIRELIEARHRESQELAFDYLADLVGDAKTIGVLDLGWSGSIQRNIARILRKKGGEVRTIGCYLACTTRASRLAIEGHEAHAYVTDEWDRVAILPEVCITACVGSTSGYARAGNGRVEPVLEHMPPMPEQIAIKQRIRDGVLAFQDTWLAVRRRPPELALPPSIFEDIDRRSAAILYRWMDYPTKPEADRLGGLYHDENYFGHSKSATLCDAENRERFRREGARAIFEHPRCYWPQGIMAQIYPRMLTVVRNGWFDARDPGRLGALSAPGVEECGLVDSELASLGHWLTKFGPAQVVFCGAFSAAVSLLATNGARGTSTAAGNAPRLIVAEGCWRGPKGHIPNHCGSATADRDGDGLCAQVRGHYADVETQRAVRGLILPGNDVALVLTGQVDDSEIESLLSGLSPFLGAKGVVLIPVGRFERDELDGRTGVGRPLQAWFEANAARLGFAYFLSSAADRPAARDWIVLWHSAEATDWMRQWMPLVTDIDLHAEAPGEPLARAAEPTRESKMPPPRGSQSVAPPEP